MTILLVILGYLAVLMLLGRLTARRSSNDVFYRGERRSPWYMVAWGMIGASISGVTFVSVPGMVLTQDMTYLQMCLGFIPGYLLVALVLLPVFYRLNLTTIYTFLGQRLGTEAYKTGAGFFLLSKMTGAAARFYVVSIILQRFVFDAWGVPFWLTVPMLLVLIWLYTRRGGIKTLVWTDSLQTLCMFGALLIIIYKVASELGFDVAGAVTAIAHDSHSRVFVFDDWVSRQNFWKQFFSGIFVVIVMTGLDQDMMQKNLSCRSLRDAQKDMISYGLAFFPANLLFLSLGVLLVLLAGQRGIGLPAAGDELLPMFAATGSLGQMALVLFILGIVAASFSSADSALTAMTTSFCVDLCGRPDDERLRRRVHVGMAVVFVLFILLFRLVNSSSVIDAIYVMCGYTYGPLLGLFAYSLTPNPSPVGREKSLTPNPSPVGRGTTITSSKRGGLVGHCGQKASPTGGGVVGTCILSPLLCFAIDQLSQHIWGYHFGYELLMLNGLLTFCGLWAVDRVRKGEEGSVFLLSRIRELENFRCIL